MTPRLDAAALLTAATAQTGLSDYGDSTLPERFAVAVEHLNNLGMDAAGVAAATEVCRWLLTSRLELLEDRNRYPIAAETIAAPMFVTGEPRSGTTLMHALMSVDPHARALRFWEVMYPSPPPGLAGPDDRRRARADDDWREINAKMPKWLHSHPYNDMLGDGLPEDERTWAFDFRVMTPTAWWRVPMQSLVGGLAVDATAQYRLHKAMLQQLQYARPRKYWVLKGFHGFRLTRDVRGLSRCDAGLAASRPGAGGRIANDDDGRHRRRHRRPGRPARRGQEAPRADPCQHRQHDEQPDGRRSADPARPLQRLHRRSGRTGPALLRVQRP